MDFLSKHEKKVLIDLLSSSLDYWDTDYPNRFVIPNSFEVKTVEKIIEKLKID